MPGLATVERGSAARNIPVFVRVRRTPPLLTIYLAESPRVHPSGSSLGAVESGSPRGGRRGRMPLCPDRSRTSGAQLPPVLRTGLRHLRAGVPPAWRERRGQALSRDRRDAPDAGSRSRGISATSRAHAGELPSRRARGSPGPARRLRRTIHRTRDTGGFRILVAHHPPRVHEQRDAVMAFIEARWEQLVGAARDEPRTGERARRWQSWSIGGYLYAKACLEDPSESTLLEDFRREAQT